VWLKLESLQTTGSFKLRGAWFSMSRLSAAERRAGVAACSAGNHGKAVAYAAREMGIRATIYVPSSVDESKHRGMLELGAQVKLSAFPGYDDTLEWAKGEARQAGLTFMSAFDDPAIMAGNGGSLALAIFEDLPEVRTFVVPVGGGGMAAGVAVTAKERYTDAVVIGCQLEASPALKMSLERGEAITRLPAVETLAGGLEGGIGAQPFDLLRTRVDRVALLSESEIYEAVRWMLEHHQQLMEPSAAVTVAALLCGKAGRLTSPAVVVVSGRNLSVTALRRILA
jgi:threonine dehydratase